MNQGTRVLVVDDDPQMQLAMRAALTRAGYDVVTVGDGAPALSRLESESFELVISDQRMPTVTGQELLREMQKRDLGLPFIMVTAYGTVNDAVEAMQLGASDFLTKPFNAEDLLRLVERTLHPERQQLRKSSRRARGGGRPIITNDAMMIRVLEVAEAVARSDATVLIQGESGTGKELIARMLHAGSPRASQPFVAVNCAALPENLLESELFGHEKGAFTGAQQRKIGKFELAHGGTILLDEISEMALPLQAKLLRVLQEREVDRVGGKDPISIDVRVLATTNRNMEAMVQAGNFRADLFYRLNVIPITLPALRERRGDITLLARHFMQQFLGEKAPELPAEVVAALEAHPWPGNVRELQNAVERAAILSQGRTPGAADFLLVGGTNSIESRMVRETTAREAEPTLPRTPLSSQIERVTTPVQPVTPPMTEERLTIRPGMTVQDMEKALILETLRSTENNRTHAAKMLGISVRTLRNKLHEYRMDGESGFDQ